MKKSTNRIQENYMKAKSLVDTLQEQANKIEQDYIKFQGIVNSDGKIPPYIWCIDNEEIFDRANEATASVIDSLGLHDAKSMLHNTEDALINFGLALAPAKERKVLTDRCYGLNGHYAHVDIRKKCIDLALKLDVRTIPKKRIAL